MVTEQASITGREELGGLSATMRALVGFYAAFNQRDLAAMEKNWAQSDEAVMDNPLGGIKRGWNAIREVYERIFNSPAEVKVEFFDYSLHESGDVFYAVGRERGNFRVEDTSIPLAIRTTRIFKRIEGEWRQLHHHGSFDDPQMLAAYQQAVNSRSG